MRYLVLSADYNSFLQDEFDENFDYLNLGLSTALVKKLSMWHEEYLPIIQMDNLDRLRVNRKILELDREGIELAKATKMQLGEVKVKYYSEGLLRYIDY